MATRNDDRVSSARLLDMLKGLQENRHLGSEPEVTEETTVYERVVVPAPGTYESENDFMAAWNTTPTEDRLPFKVYITPISNADAPTFPLVVGEPTGDYVEITKKVDIEGQTLFAEDTFEDITTYTGYLIGQLGAWGTTHFEDGQHDGSFLWAWEMSEKTETTTTKTKRTIKQDYLPNADWNQNDPDGEGYVEGRTHWVEVSETEAAVNVQTGAVQGNLAMGTCDKFGAVKSFTYPNGEYNPNRIGEVISVNDYGPTIQFSYIGEDANGNAITPATYDDLVVALSITNIGIILVKQGDDVSAFIAYPNVNANDVCTAIVISENIHKLDRKFYDYVDGDAITEYVEESIKAIESDTRIDGPQYFAVGYNYGYHYSSTLKDKIVEINDLELVTTNPHQLWLKKGRYSNINSMENGDFLVCNSQGGEFYTGKNIKTPVAGSPYHAIIEETDITTFDTFIPLWRHSATGAAHPYYVIVNNDNNFVPRIEDRSLIGTAVSSFPSDCKIFFICYVYPTYKGGADPLDNYYGATKAIKNQQGQITGYYTAGNSREIYSPYEPNGTGIYVRRVDGRSGISRGNETLLRPFKLTQQHETITINEDERYWTDNVEFYYYYRSNGINKRGKAVTSVAKEGNNYTISITFDNEETDIYVWCEPIPSIPLNCYTGVDEFLNDYFLTLASHQK